MNNKPNTGLENWFCLLRWLARSAHIRYFLLLCALSFICAALLHANHFVRHVSHLDYSFVFFFRCADWRFFLFAWNHEQKKKKKKRVETDYVAFSLKPVFFFAFVSCMISFFLFIWTFDGSCNGFIYIERTIQSSD